MAAEAGSSSSATQTDEQVMPNALNGAASVLVSRVSDMMAACLDAGQFFNNLPTFTKLCDSMAKGIDYAVANNEVPVRANELLPLLQRVYEAPEEDPYIVGLMMLSISLQCACKLEWFSQPDTEAFLQITKKVMKYFSHLDHIQTQPIHALSWLSAAIKRYYPTMKIKQLLFSILVLAAEPEYKICVTNFPVIRGSISPGNDKIYLFVIQLDGLNAAQNTFIPSDPIILLNGQNVKTRATVLMENGIQVPIDVTTLVKNGINLVQTVGEIYGPILIAFALTSRNEQNQPPNTTSAPLAFSGQIPRMRQPGTFFRLPIIRTGSSGAAAASSSINLHLNQQNPHCFGVPNLNTHRAGSVHVSMHGLFPGGSGGAFCRCNQASSSSHQTFQPFTANAPLRSSAAEFIEYQRPVKRMRGSLQGRAYPVAFQQYIPEPVREVAEATQPRQSTGVNRQRKVSVKLEDHVEPEN